MARVTRAYNYRSYVRHLIGPAWPVFDVLWIIFMLVISGLVTSAGATVLSDTFGIPELPATIGILAAAGLDPSAVVEGSLRDHPEPRPRDLTLRSVRPWPGPEPSPVP